MVKPTPGNVAALEARGHTRTEQVDVEFHSQLGGRPICVWGCVNVLRDAMDLTGQLVTISADHLAHFAQHGSLPGGAK